jgi:hypothetical protein
VDHAYEEIAHTVDLALRRRGGLNRADGNRRVGRTIAARRQLAARDVSFSRESGASHGVFRTGKKPETKTWRNEWRHWARNMTAPNGGCAQRSPISAGRAIAITLLWVNAPACMQALASMPQTRRSRRAMLG